MFNRNEYYEELKNLKPNFVIAPYGWNSKHFEKPSSITTKEHGRLAHGKLAINTMKKEALIGSWNFWRNNQREIVIKITEKENPEEYKKLEEFAFKIHNDGISKWEDEE